MFIKNIVDTLRLKEAGGNKQRGVKIQYRWAALYGILLK
jgi:hypothetical protein